MWRVADKRGNAARQMPAVSPPASAKGTFTACRCLGLTRQILVEVGMYLSGGEMCFMYASLLRGKKVCGVQAPLTEGGMSCHAVMFA